MLTTFIENMSVKMASDFISPHKFEPLRKFFELVEVKNDILLFKCKTKKKMAGDLAPAVSYANNSPTKLYGESSISYHIQYPQQENEVLSVNKSKLTELSSSWCTAAGAITGDCRD